MAFRRTWFILCVISTLVFLFSSGYEVDPQIAASIAEGEELMREIDEFLEDPAVPQNVKTAFNDGIHDLAVETAENIGETLPPATTTSTATTTPTTSTTPTTTTTTTTPTTPTTTTRLPAKTPGCYRTAYRQHITYYAVPQSCPSHLYTCCEGHFWFTDSICMNIDQLRALLEYFKQIFLG